MKIIFLILIVASFTWSCEEQKMEDNVKINACGVTSIEQLPWFNNLINGKESCTVYEGARFFMQDYNGEKVFYFENGLSSKGVCTRGVYNCSGQLILSASNSSESWLHFETTRTNQQLVWERKK